MREIKFRGKNSPQHSWVYGYYHTHYDGSFFNLISKVDPEEMTTHEYPVDERSVGQFIGVKDSAGNEIYEGDIIHNKAWAMKGVVFWDNDYFNGWAVRTGKNEIVVLDNMGEVNKAIHCIVNEEQCTDECSIKDCLIIGNIYDNPELAV